MATYYCHKCLVWLTYEPELRATRRAVGTPFGNTNVRHPDLEERIVDRAPWGVVLPSRPVMGRLLGRYRLPSPGGFRMARIEGALSVYPLPCVTVSNEVVSMAALAAGLASKALTAQSPLANRGRFFCRKYESKLLRSDPL